MDFHLASLRLAKAQGKDVDGQIADVLIAMVKDAYVRGDVSIESLENTVETILSGGSIAMIAEGGPEAVISRAALAIHAE